MAIIYDNEVFLLSGTSTNGTGILNVRGFNNLNFQYYGQTTGTVANSGIIGTSGDLSLNGRVVEGSPYVNFFSTQLRNSTGNYVAYSNIVWNSIQAVVSNYSGGLITIAVRAQS